MSEIGKREQFLISMYNQMMNDINRHIIVVWQSITTLIATFAALTLVNEEIIPLDIAVSGIIVVCIWLIAHIYDASYWYNRNLVIIANIERQFLAIKDLKEIHYYFGCHRPKNCMISHLKIQRNLGLAVALLVLGFHFYSEILPILHSIKDFQVINTIPWVFAFVGCLIWRKSAIDYSTKYKEFIDNSPGLEMDTKGITYGIGHGFKSSLKSRICQ